MLNAQWALQWLLQVLHVTRRVSLADELHTCGPGCCEQPKERCTHHVRGNQFVRFGNYRFRLQHFVLRLQVCTISHQVAACKPRRCDSNNAPLEGSPCRGAWWVPSRRCIVQFLSAAFVTIAKVGAQGLPTDLCKRASNLEGKMTLGSAASQQAQYDPAEPSCCLYVPHVFRIVNMCLL